jgi:hypothetical protein
VTFTYDSTNLTSDLAKVRSSIGDVVDMGVDGGSLTDEEINRHISAMDSLELAAVRAQEDRIARLAIVVDRSAAGVNSAQGQKLLGMEKHLKILMKRAGKGRMTCYAGDISTDRLNDAKDDTDFPQPSFEVGMDDKP